MYAVFKFTTTTAGNRKIVASSSRPSSVGWIACWSRVEAGQNKGARARVPYRVLIRVYRKDGRPPEGDKQYNNKSLSGSIMIMNYFCRLISISVPGLSSATRKRLLFSEKRDAMDSRVIGIYGDRLFQLWYSPDCSSSSGQRYRLGEFISFIDGAFCRLLKLGIQSGTELWKHRWRKISICSGFCLQIPSEADSICILNISVVNIRMSWSRIIGRMLLCFIVFKHIGLAATLRRGLDRTEKWFDLEETHYKG